MTPIQKVTRLAPSPTGALHLGNARTFLVNYLLARQQGWRILLRIEDLDGPRIKKGAAAQLLEDLHWLGIQWDQGPEYQLPRLPIYAAATDKLLQSHLAYPCICTRKEIDLAASAPHAEDGAAIYPGTCRGRFTDVHQAQSAAGRMPAIRFQVNNQPVIFTDLFLGPQQWLPEKQLGDFVIAKADGVAAYQLAVVVDDSAAQVTHIVRGDDLLDSTPRQILLYRALGLAEQIPSYYHLPLVVGTDGRRLAKRHGDTRLSFYRRHGVSPERMLALLARWCGMEPCEQITLPRLLADFSLAHLPRQPIVFTAEDDAWLRRLR